MGLTVSVYRNVELSGDFTAGGVSGRRTALTLINVEGPSEPTETAPAAILESHVKGCLRIVPVTAGKRPWFQSGGNFAHTSDSRFSEACEKLLGVRWYGAVAIHDRVEGGKDYGGN